MTTILELNKHNTVLVLGSSKASPAASPLASLSILNDKLGQTLALTSGQEEAVAAADELTFIDEAQLNAVTASLREALGATAKMLLSRMQLPTTTEAPVTSTAPSSTSTTTTAPASTNTTSSSPSMQSVWELEAWISTLEEKLQEGFASRAEQDQEIVNANMSDLRTQNQKAQEKYKQDHTHHSWLWKLGHALKDIAEAVTLVVSGVTAGMAEVSALGLKAVGCDKGAALFDKVVDAYVAVFNDMKNDPELGDVLKGVEYVGMAAMIAMSIFDPALLVFAIVMITLSETNGLDKLSTAIADKSGMPKWAADLVVMGMVTVATMGLGAIGSIEVGSEVAAEEASEVELANLNPAAEAVVAEEAAEEVAEEAAEEAGQNAAPKRQSFSDKLKLAASEGFGTGIGSLTMVNLPNDIAKAAGDKEWMIILFNLLGLIIALGAMFGGAAAAEGYAPQGETVASRLTGKSPFGQSIAEALLPLAQGVGALSQMIAGELLIAKGVLTYEKGVIAKELGQIEANIALINATLQATNTTMQNDQAWVTKMNKAYENEVDNFNVFGLAYQAASEVHV